MPDHRKTETAVAAAGVVGMADQIMQAVRDNRDHHRPNHSNEHYLKAVIAGAIAIGAFEMLRRAEGLEHHGEEHHHESSSGHHHGSEHDSEQRHASHGNNDGHTTDLAAEALGAYSLGRQILGHTHHPILKLVAEGLGAAALAREAERDLL